MRAPEFPLLLGLEGGAAAAVREQMVPMTLGSGRALFEQGEDADALYALVTGSIGISTRDPRTGASRRIAYLRPPDTVGEMALLSPAPRSATATALRETHLLQLTRRSFERVIERYPAVLHYFARLLAERLRVTEVDRPVRETPRSFAVLPLTDGPCAIEFGRRLADAFGETLPGSTGCLMDWPDGADEAWFHAFEARHARTVFVSARMDTPWCQQCLRHADHVLLLTVPGRPPRPSALAHLAEVRSDWIRRDLVIRQASDAPRPRELHPGVAALPVSMRIQVRESHAEDFRRLVRLANGTARGLVLGGGGARGFAHLGVLRALDEAGLAVDFIGGTSMGAIVAASVAMGCSPGHIEAWARSSFVGRNPLDDYTLPYVALTRGAKVDAGLAERFGEHRIEDLWLPFFCVSSNLTTGTVMVHRRGGLAGALRASIAIPGLLPPVCTDDGVLVDGGMMNNLPADVMAAMARGPVLAVDAGSDLAFHNPSPRSWGGRLVRRWLGVPGEVPTIAQLLLRAATVSGDAQTALALDHADVVLRPPLSGIDLRAWTRFEAIASIAYRHARAAIAEGRLREWAWARP